MSLLPLLVPAGEEGTMMGENTGDALALYCRDGVSVKDDDDGSDGAEVEDVKARGRGAKLRGLCQT